MKEEDLTQLYTVEQTEWQNVADLHKGTIVTKWGMKPAAIRVDQIDRDVDDHEQSIESDLRYFIHIVSLSLLFATFLMSCLIL